MKLRDIAEAGRNQHRAGDRIPVEEAGGAEFHIRAGRFDQAGGDGRNPVGFKRGGLGCSGRRGVLGLGGDGGQGEGGKGKQNVAHGLVDPLWRLDFRLLVRLVTRCVWQGNRAIDEWHLPDHTGQICLTD